ncbi:hypothetical protein EG831_05370, partial [bacterium]|nr:hypothetical protein [bacterium]
LAWAAGGAMALLLVGWLTFLGLTKTAETRWSRMRDRWLEAKAVLDANTELQHGIAIIRKLPGRELDGPRIMYELSRMTPERSWLTSVSITSRLQQGEGENGIGTVLRMKLTGAAETEDQLIQLMRALERSQLLSKPELRMMERSREGTAGPLRFEIIAGVR